MCGLAILLHGSFSDKCQLLFKVFNIHGDEGVRLVGQVGGAWQMKRLPNFLTSFTSQTPLPGGSGHLALYINVA